MILFGKNIKKLRKENRYTQTELAILLGITKSTVASYENDSRQPSYDVLVKLAEVFHVSIDNIVLGSTDRILKVNELKEEQIKTLQLLIDTFEKSNLIDDAIELNSTAVIDNILKIKELADKEEYSKG